MVAAKHSVIEHSTKMAGTEHHHHHHPHRREPTDTSFASVGSFGCFNWFDDKYRMNCYDGPTKNRSK
jgi:hypothetical protein